MKMCDRCRVPGCLLDYNGKACENARKEHCPDVVFTNADHIRSMTDEELAEIWVEPHCDRRTTPECKSFHGDCIACALDWLKQPYKEAGDA